MLIRCKNRVKKKAASKLGIKQVKINIASENTLKYII